MPAFAKIPAALGCHATGAPTCSLPRPPCPLAWRDEGTGLHYIALLQHRQGAWEELIQRCEDVGVDAFEINFSCPHGMPERKMGMAMGQDCDLLGVSVAVIVSFELGLTLECYQSYGTVGSNA